MTHLQRGVGLICAKVDAHALATHLVRVGAKVGVRVGVRASVSVGVRVSGWVRGQGG